MRVAILGSTGQLGSDLVRVLSETGEYQIVALPHSEVEVKDAASVRRAVLASQPDVVVNCAAYVRVDEAEDHAEEAFAVNALGAFHVARAATEAGALCVYISTDYVFDGGKESPYTEEDVPCPLNVYGASKLAGEQLTRIASSRWLVVRVASLFGRAGARGKAGNFVDRILAKAQAGDILRVVSDVRMSPTYSLDAARAIAGLLQEEATGVVHAANRGCTTWYRFAKTALELAGVGAAVEPVLSKDYPSKARRPLNSALASARDGNFVSALRPWEVALGAYLSETSHRLGLTAPMRDSPA